MKKKLCFTTLLALSISLSFAQLSKPEKFNATPAKIGQLTSLESAVSVVEKDKQPMPSLHTMKTATQEYVGTSIYDLQTNNSIQNRIIASEDGIYAIYMYSDNSAGGTNPDRGTGYNMKNGTWGSPPSNRIENERTGFPCLVHTGSNREIVFSHVSTGSIRQWSRNTIGSGTWTGSTVPSNLGRDLRWPKAAAGGADGNTIHMICLTRPIFNGGTAYEGMDGALLYYRSLDGGITWDITDSLLNEIDNAHFNGFSEEGYSVYAKGDKVVIGSFNEFADSFVLISEDNGNTWTKSIINDFPIDLWSIDDGTDIELDGLQDTITTCDGAGAVFIDADNVVHAAFGILVMTDEIGGVVDEVYDYFPLNGAIYYWNSTMLSSDEVYEIGNSPDNNDAGPEGTTEIGKYGNSGLCSHPQFAQDSNGNLFVTYMAINDLYFNGFEYYRHIYAIRSDDDGVNWTAPADLTPDLNENTWEYAYPALAPVMVDDKLHLLVMRDEEPGTHIEPEEIPDPVTDNDMIYICVTNDLVHVESTVLTAPQTLSIYPNPTSDQCIVDFPQEVSGQVMVYDATGKCVLQQRVSSDMRTIIQVQELPAGIYQITITGETNLYTGSFVKH